MSRYVAGRRHGPRIEGLGVVDHHDALAATKEAQLRYGACGTMPWRAATRRQRAAALQLTFSLTPEVDPR